MLNSELLLRDYICVGLPTTTSTPTTPTLWKPPPDGYIKINSNGAYDQASRNAGLSVVARDGRGLVLGGLAQHSPTSFDVLHVEFLVVQAGLFACS
ncbi:hypothetical protein V6N12_068330 [Hibiscus sabdariffa]|uniref:RNase H type-1 domain-containing protein n=1 Tax=Hibiscus sabdariffa TaxID=183260 RepID=A0ABR2FPM2_9ROSI